jgi:plasmid maintenance system killer protein
MYYNTAVVVIAVPPQTATAPPHTSKRSSLADSALSEMKANLASALVPIRRSTESAVPARSSAKSTTRSMERLAEKQWAMTVNGRWRICFEFRNGDAFDVEIVDYHKG